MYLNIQCLGRLQSASIDLGKSLTIFVGRNNTSKTYVAHTIYALHRFGADYLTESAQALVAEQKLPSTGSVEIWHHEISVLDLLMPHVPRLVSGLGAHLKARLPSIFATDDQFFATTRLELQLLTSDEPSIRERIIAQELDFLFEVRNGRLSYRKLSGSSTLSIDFTTVKPSNDLSKKRGAWEGTLLVPINILLLQAMLPGSGGPFILSTERSAIQLFSRELFSHRSRLVDDIHEGAGDFLSQIGRESRFYPLAIRDELRVINEMPYALNESSTLAPLATRLEILLGGTVALGDSGDLMYKPDGLDRALGLHVSASSVKSLAGLAFYLRHMASSDGLLVIDEPELNLHPDNQRRIARILAAVARAGVRVLISTHSDIIIRELSNLIALHAPEAAELREKHGYSESETLDGATVGAYLFDETHARSIDVQKTGIEVESIDNEINAMNRVAKDIYFTLQSKNTNS